MFSTKPDGPMRQLVFGPGGYGMVTYLVLEDEQRVDVLRVQRVSLFPRSSNCGDGTGGEVATCRQVKGSQSLFRAAAIKLW